MRLKQKIARPQSIPVGTLPAAQAPALPRSSPEAQGLSSAAIQIFVEAAGQHFDAMNSFMLVRHGQVVAEGWWAPYDAETRHALFSLSKSFTSTAVGLAVAERRMSIDDPVLSFFPEDAPTVPSENLKAMRVRDLLSMSSGHQAEAIQHLSFTAPGRLTREFLALPVAHKPGTHFAYNTPATYMLSAIVQQVTGLTVLDYLRPRLFEPLGIPNPAWDASAQGITLGGYGLSIRTEDIARFGQLYLQQGVWQGRRLLPAEWVAAATTRQTSTGSNPDSDWDQGYGYQFWRCRHGVYRADGAFGQFCIVLPEQDAIVVITSGVGDIQALLNLVWEKLLPALQTAPLPPDPTAQERLVRKLADLSLPPLEAAASSPLAAQVTGRKYVVSPNARHIEALTCEFSGDQTTLVIRAAGGEHRIACGHGVWLKGSTAFVDALDQQLVRVGDQRIAACGAWTAADTYTVKLRPYETPYCLTLRLRFSGNQLIYDAEYNMSFGPTKLPQLVGPAE
ncbi:MAG: serine hydrolase [Opitutaceae bacterium]